MKNKEKIHYLDEMEKDGWCGNWFSPENYPEFWELVVEKDYEILSLIEGKFIYPCNKYSKDYINQLFNTLGVSIHSVKRLSDGEIFTIGDKTNYDIIKKIKVNHDSFCIITKDYNIWNKSKTIVNFCKQPIFKTEDGVDIFEGDKFYIVNINSILLNEIEDEWKPILSWINNKNNLTKEFPSINQKFFSTKEKAEEYILYNKPLLTLKDIEELLCKNTSSYFLEKFKKRAQKLNNKN